MRREEKSDLISALQSSLKEANGVFVITPIGFRIQSCQKPFDEIGVKRHRF